MSQRLGKFILEAPLWVMVILCSLLPLGWLAAQVITQPAAWSAWNLSPFQWQLLGRTLLYNAAVAALATVMGLPAALVIGRGSARWSRALAMLLPLPLLLPSITYAYGWSQVLRMLRCWLEPASGLDVARCVWTLATWLWAVPAALVGLSLRRMDSNLQQQALLDGAYWRVTLRTLAAPIAASAAIVMVLAMQEFAVYEPTGISVVATEVRVAFDVGTIARSPQEIMAAGPAAGADFPLSSESQRAAMAVATAMPLLACVAILALLAAWAARRMNAADEVAVDSWPAALDAPRWAVIFSVLMLIITVGTPAIAMVLSIVNWHSLGQMLLTFSPEVIGSLWVAAIAGALAMVMALSQTSRRTTLPLLLGMISFLVGGQLLAIAQIRLYNRRGLGWVYNAPPVVVMAYMARFGWLAMFAGRATWGRNWRQLRELAATDGAGPLRCAVNVVWPLAWPVLLAAGVLVMALSVTEVPATVLLSPQRPRMFTPLLMTWVHTLRSDDMLQGSLLLMGLALTLALVALILLRIGRKWFRWGTTIALLLAIVFFVGGCSRSDSPREIWCETGAGPAQVIYPRGISYSSSDDTYFIVDRMARIQHLDGRGHFINGWRMPEWQHGKPVGLSCGPDGNLYVADTHYARVVVYSREGQMIRTWGKEGRGPGEFIYPTDIAFDRAGNVYVSEYGDHDRIQVFDKLGNYQREFGRFGQGDGEFSRPQSIMIDGDLLYATDACNHRLCVFKTDGTFVRNMGHLGSGLGEFRFPYGLSKDRDGNLVVCEFGNNRVQLVEKNTGRGLRTWGSGGREAGQLAYPWAVAVDRQNRVVVVDSGNNRLQVFGF